MRTTPPPAQAEFTNGRQGEESKDKGRDHSPQFLAVIRDAQAGGMRSLFNLLHKWGALTANSSRQICIRSSFFFLKWSKKAKKILTSPKEGTESCPMDYPCHSCSICSLQGSRFPLLLLALAAVCHYRHLFTPQPTTT